MFEWITVCAHAYLFFFSRHHCGESMRVCARSLLLRSSCRDTLRHRGTQTQFVVVSWVSSFLCRGVPFPAVHSQSVEVAREVGMHECGWGRNGECSGQFCYLLLPFFQLRATEKGHCTLMSGEKNVVWPLALSVSVLGACMGAFLCFSLESAL